MSRIEETRSAAQAHYPSGTNHEEVKVASFIRGARYADKTMIEKACNWLKNNWREYVYQDRDGIVHFGHWESDFRKAMEE